MKADNACPDCNGTRFILGTGDIGDGQCSACNGSGNMNAIDAIAPALLGQDQSCETCHGSGKCQTCGGSGTI